MQAAGRLRQLGPGRQTLHVVGTPDVTDKIKAANRLTSGSSSSSTNSSNAGMTTSRTGVQTVHVLRWVMANTVEANQHGVVQWAGHGLRFAATHDTPESAWVDETMELKDFYGGSKGEKPVGDVVAAMVKQQMRRCSSDSSRTGLGATQREILREVEQRSVKYGEGHSVRAGQGADEECERELEKEGEEEEEMEVQVARAEARQEVYWQYGVAPTAASADELQADAAGLQLMCLSDVAKQMLQPGCIGEVPWAAGVYASKGFLHAVEQPQSAGGATAARSNLSEYLRPVVDVLVLPNKEVVLLSEREAEGLLEQWLAQRGISSSSRVGGTTGSGAEGPYLISLAYAQSAGGRGPLATALVPAAATAYQGMQQQQQELVEVPELVSMQLFNGGASFATTEQRQWLKGMMRGRRNAAEALVSMRGMLPMFPRSDLEKACDVRVGEDH